MKQNKMNGKKHVSVHIYETLNNVTRWMLSHDYANTNSYLIDSSLILWSQLSWESAHTFTKMPTTYKNLLWWCVGFSYHLFCFGWTANTQEVKIA